MMKSRTQRIAIIGIAAALVIGGGSAAYAYWSSTGTGTGTATTGTSDAFVVTSDAPAGDPLTPGGDAQTVDFTVGNPGTGDLTLTAVDVTVANSDGTAWVLVPGCSAADYAVTVTALDDGVVAGGADAAGTAAITMLDSATDQDACKGVTVPLYFVAS
jgi:hypothetical protein